MANLLLTEVCVRKCPYCFAKQYMEGVEDRSAITKDNLVYVVNFLEKSGKTAAQKDGYVKKLSNHTRFLQK